MPGGSTRAKSYLMRMHPFLESKTPEVSYLQHDRNYRLNPLPPKSPKSSSSPATSSIYLRQIVTK
ncbi:MAG: hypothetical protein JJT78_16655 [Leptospira sp.]|nr:hypothetical protein [Leptospira sp.]